MSGSLSTRGTRYKIAPARYQLLLCLHRLFNFESYCHLMVQQNVNCKMNPRTFNEATSMYNFALF